MKREELNELYDEAILEENRQPYHFGKRADADLVIEAYNPLCGDQFKVFLYADQGAITSAYFHGYGCAVSKASTSVLTRELEGLSLAEAKARCIVFLNWLSQHEQSTDSVPVAWQAFAAVRKFPGRLACAQLAWQVIAQEI